MTPLTENITDMQQLNALLDRYFDGVETDADLRWLRLLLSPDAELPDIAIDAATAERLAEALAVMSAAAMMTASEATAKTPGPATSKIRRATRHAYVWSVAASVAVVLAVGVSLITPSRYTGAHTHAEGDHCIAFVGGKRIDDTDQVMRMMRSQLSEAGDAASSVNPTAFGDLSDIRSAMNEHNND